MNTVTKIYEGSNITFSKDKSIMVNATEMAKPFGKQPIDWLKTSPAQEYINAYSKLNKISLADLQTVIRGGNNPGTWFHQDIALEFARWLSPEFSIWCNAQIKELLTTGSVSLNVPQTFAEALRLAADQQEKIEEQQKKIAADAPKVDFFDAVAESKNAVSMDKVSKNLGIQGLGRNNLYKLLREQKVLMNDNIPYQQYVDRGYFRVIEQKWTGKDGMPQISYKTLVYQKGLDYIRRIVKDLF